MNTAKSEAQRLPRESTCQHCKWAGKERLTGKPIVMCWNSTAIDEFSFSANVGFRTVAVRVEPDHTCKHWEARRNEKS